MAEADISLPSYTTGCNNVQGDRSPPAPGAEQVCLIHMAPDEDAHTAAHTDLLTGSCYQTLNSHNQAPSRDEITIKNIIRRQTNSV